MPAVVRLLRILLLACALCCGVAECAPRLLAWWANPRSFAALYFRTKSRPFYSDIRKSSISVNCPWIAPLMQDAAVAGWSPALRSSIRLDWQVELGQARVCHAGPVCGMW